MGDVPPDRCPNCGFNYAWDGDRCGHCRFAWDGPEPDVGTATQVRASPTGDAPARGPAGIVARLAGKLGLLCVGMAVVVLGCLVLFAQMKERIGWLGLESYTTAYLLGSVGIGLADVLEGVLLLRSGGRTTRLMSWMSGVTYLWIPISVGIAARLLPNAVPWWLPGSYLAWMVGAGTWAGLTHWRVLKEVVAAAVADKEFPIDRMPVGTKRGALLGGAIGAAFACASGVLLIG